MNKAIDQTNITRRRLFKKNPNKIKETLADR